MRKTLTILAALMAVPALATASPPVPSGPHPRLFMSAQEIAGYTANAKNASSAAAGMVKSCQDTIDNPNDYTARGGSDADTWPGSAVSCAFAYEATQNSQYLTQAIKYWRASLNDDQMIGDGAGCVAGVSTDWQTWETGGESGNSPPILATITHDTGYPMRWYGPDVALTYDWLNTAPGVDAGLLAQTRVCLTNWMDWYGQYGYHHDEAGSNYNAGFVIGESLASIAIGNDGGADGHLWTQVNDDVFGKLLVGQGLAGASTGVGTSAGVMLGGDWGEGWQYGILSVLEYAISARALEENGALLPDMDAWTNSLVVRYVHGNVPKMDQQWVGGDFDPDDTPGDPPVIYQSPTSGQLNAVLAGPSSPEAASWAAYLKQQQMPSPSGFVYDAFAELNTAKPVDYRAQMPTPPLWYLARGTRAMYARTSWDPSAYWGVFESAPQVNSDHHHFSASNFVFSRGVDHLVVDPSAYGCRGTLPTNAVTADSPGVTGTYAPSQTPWSQAELLWARGAGGAVYAARSDFSKAFIFSDTPSDISYAHREWVMLPEGEVVTIDRVQTGSASRNMYVNFHTNTGGTLALTGTTAAGAVGGSTLAIHAVSLSGGTASITQPTNDDGDNCYDGTCTDVRLNVDEYSIRVPGPFAVAIHAIDGLATGEAQATVGSINDDNYDPAPKQNAGVIGAAVYRSTIQSYVIASSAQNGASGATMTYGVPGQSAGRHIVFDAPEDANGKSTVAATVENGRCVVTITAGAGFTGHPLMFQISGASNGCKAVEDTDVGSAVAPPDGGVMEVTNGSGSGGGSAGVDGSGPAATGGCGCIAGDENGTSRSLAVGSVLTLVTLFRWRRRRARQGRRPRSA